MKKNLLIAIGCLCLYGCGNDAQKQTTVCVREDKNFNMTSIEIYNSQSNNIISYSLGMLYSFNTTTEALEKEKELLNVYEDKSLISLDGKDVYEWTLKDVETTGNLNDKINELQTNRYVCETRDVE